MQLLGLLFLFIAVFRCTSAVSIADCKCPTGYLAVAEGNNKDAKCYPVVRSGFPVVSCLKNDSDPPKKGPRLPPVSRDQHILYILDLFFVCLAVFRSVGTISVANCNCPNAYYETKEKDGKVQCYLDPSSRVKLPGVFPCRKY